MGSTVTSTDEVDHDISVSSLALGIARAAFERCPSAENARRVAAALADVDRLLDARLAAR